MAKRVRPKTKIQFNPLESEFDLNTDNNFSYESVPANKKLKIYENMQMVLHDGFELEGFVDLQGSIVLED